LKKIIDLLRAIFSAPVDAATLRPPLPYGTTSSKPEPAAAPAATPVSHPAVTVHPATVHAPEADPSAALANAMAVVRARNPSALEGLNPPAREADLALCEQALQLKLPAGVRALYLAFDGASDLACGLFGGWRWLPIAQATEIAAELRLIELDDPSGGYDAALALPLLDCDGDILYVECGDDQTRLYYRDHECPTREQVASSLGGFLREFAARIESGALVFSVSETPQGRYFSYSPVNRSYWPPDFDGVRVAPAAPHP
jgi:cell wall assembly regulator SMI1